MRTIKEISRRFAVFLALMIFISSCSYNVDFHYCQGQLKSFSVFGKAKNCHELAEKMASCHHHKINDSEAAACSDDKNCCNNVTEHFESELTDQLLSSVFLDLNTSSELPKIEIATCFGALDNEEELHPNKYYKPPLIQKDLPILFESFLL